LVSPGVTERIADRVMVYESLVVAEDAEEELLQEAASSRKIARGKAAVIAAALAFVGLAVGALCVAPITKRADVGARLGFSAEEEASAAPPACAADGEACMESQCCLAGGDKGLQCYKKNDDYASCAPSCEPGVHEPEEEVFYDESGTEQKAQWTCEEVGERSKPGCHSFTNKSKSACPTDYCKLNGAACVPKCDTFGGADGCWGSKTCMWQDDACMDACWNYGSGSTCQPSNKCTWTGAKCQMGWWLFYDAESCPQDLGYKFNGSCVPDPCSMDGDDCSSTKCCSTERGAGGMTCFQKDDTWAACRETCEEGEEDDKWSCKALGERAKFDAGCAWAGNDCKTSKLCCNRGFVCAVKDEEFTGCVLTKSTSTWVSASVAIPAEWEGTVVGAGRDEYEMQPAGAEEPKAGTTLYCWIAFMPDSYEVGLVDMARNNKGSIFGCDAHDTFHTWQGGSGGWDTGESTLMNTDVFIKVWEQVGERGDYINYDWTVKVDPDCVFSPDRLRGHIDSWNMPPWASVYVKNNGQDPGLGNNGFLGAIEILSKKAVMIYLDNAQGCLDAMGTESGEDGFMKAAMDGLGIGYVLDVDIFFPDNGPGACMNEARVAFHPLKDPDDWQHCWDILLGKVPF